MAKLKKSWREKLADDKDLPRVVEITANMSQRWGTGTVVIPAPREVDEIMRSVPRGKLITINQNPGEASQKTRSLHRLPDNHRHFCRYCRPCRRGRHRRRGEKILSPTGGR